MAVMARNFDLTANVMPAPRKRSLREDAYDRAAREARRYLAGGTRSYPDIRARLNELIAEGRRDHADGRLPAREVKAWDTSFRIMFLLGTWRPL